VGGTGKTPHIEFLISRFQQKYKVATISRGYGRKTKGYILADENSTAEEIGDEPFQFIMKFPTIKVAVDEKRNRAIRKLLAAEDAPDLILLDDAFQHRSVKPGINILLTDYSHLFIDDYVVPSGRLRE
ncbi:tetraacyldisaccharide 4'-kinase, partial [Acinetobacter baumannii]|uniref:tetraacyldisaccharide 4'-kinase n=1 Tax=Acinetobacter baumannii TaxID=470 RepID=UPI00189A0524